MLIDGIGTWLTAVLDECGAWGGTRREKVTGRIAELIAAWRQTRALVVAVSDEAGMGVVPATPAGRLFRDELGRLNQALAAESEETELIVAGRVLPAGRLGKQDTAGNSMVTITRVVACYVAIQLRCLLGSLASRGRRRYRRSLRPDTASGQKAMG